MLLISSAVCSLPLLYLLSCFAIYLSTNLSVLLDCELLQCRGPDSQALTQSKQSNVSGMDKLAARALRHIIRPLWECNLLWRRSMKGVLGSGNPATQPRAPSHHSPYSRGTGCIMPSVLLLRRARPSSEMILTCLRHVSYIVFWKRCSSSQSCPNPMGKRDCWERVSAPCPGCSNYPEHYS